MIRRLALGLGCVIAMLAGCGSEQGDLAQSTETVSRELQDATGRTVGTVSIDRTELRSSERMNVHVTLQPDDYQSLAITSVAIEAALPEDLALVSSRIINPESDGDGAGDIIQEYTIEALLPGTYEIQPIEVSLARGEETIIASTESPIAISVSSAFAEGDEVAFSDVTGVVDPKAEPIAWWVWASIAGGAMLVLALGAWLLVRLTKVREAKPTYRAAHELALERLDKLDAMNLPAQGKLEKLHDEASLILRCYIEDRYLLHAPERTTEEFLHEARSSAMLMEEEVIALEVFLKQCDMVKFARFEPAATQAARTLQTVRDFVERTKSADKLVAFLNGQIVGRVDRRELEKVA